MVRETRHLWVRNLPDNIREERIRDHFKRYGRVQSVKIFSRKGGSECDNGLVCGPTGIYATVSFMDIKSASKAHNSEHKLDDYVLATEYHEPAPIPSSPATPAVPSTVSAAGSPVTPATPSTLRHAPPYASPRISYGPEDLTTFDTRSSHFFERRDGTDTYVRRPPSAYVVSPSESLRGRTRERDRLYRNGPTHYTPILESVVARTPATHHRSVTASSWSAFESTNCPRYPASLGSTSAEVLSYAEDRRDNSVSIVVHKKNTKSRRKCRVMPRCGSNGSESVSNHSDSSRSRSHSSSSSSHSRSSSSSSDSSSAAISERSCSTHSHHGSLKSAVTVHSAVSTPLTNCSPVVHTDDRRPLALCVRNLPSRPSDNSLKDGLYHEFKKYGKVTKVKMHTQGTNRSAVVHFKKADDAEKALLLSHDKSLFGTKIDVSVYQGFDSDDTELRLVGEPDMDEYHPKATRTLFIGNLGKDVTQNDLHNTFSKYGVILKDIDLRKQGPTYYAFIQYCDISCVVKAMHSMDGEYIGSNKINLGYGKSNVTNCLWVAGVADCVTEKQLIGSFSQFGRVTHVDINRSQGKALVFFEEMTHAEKALITMRGYVLKNRRLMADFASVECQKYFYECYDKSKSLVSSYETNCQDSPRSTSSTRGLDTPVSTTSTNSGTKHSANNGSVNNSSKVHSRFQHATSSSRTTPTRQLVQHTPSSSCASPIVNNTPSPSPSTSSRSTPHPQHTSRFDYNNTLECSSDKRLSRSLEELDLNVENGGKLPPTPHEDGTLVKEREALLDQLNDYSSSAEEEEELVTIKQQSTPRQLSTSCEESRPGTPLFDERPENILAHYESRRAAKEKNATSNGPLTLPLPSFFKKAALKVRGTADVDSDKKPSPDHPSKSPHQSKPLTVRQLENLEVPTSSNHVWPLRAKGKPNASDTKPYLLHDAGPPETTKAPWLDSLKSFDERYEKWSGRTTGRLDTSSVQVRHKLLDVNAIGKNRSEICESMLSRKSVFDDHLQRLETISDQQPPINFVPPPRPAINNLCKSPSTLAVVNPLPNLSSRLPQPPPPSTTNNVSSSVMKGLQYPFPSHPPVKPALPLSKLTIPFVSSSSSSTSSLSSASSLSSKPSPSPDLVQSPSISALAPVYPSSHPSSQRSSSSLLRNNSVEKLTELPKSTSSVPGGRDPHARLEAEVKKSIITSPICSRRNSGDNVTKKSVDEEKESRKPCDPKPVVNHIDAGKTHCNTIPTSCKTGKDDGVSDDRSATSSRRSSIDRKPVVDDPHEKKEKQYRKTEDLEKHVDNVSATSSCKKSNAEKENSVLDKRKRSLDKTDGKNNAVSVILHTSQKGKLSLIKQEPREIDEAAAAASDRRSSTEPASPKDDRLSASGRHEESKCADEKHKRDFLNHEKAKVSSSKSDSSKPQHHKSEDAASKTSKPKRKSDDDKHKHESHSRPGEPKRESLSSTKPREVEREKKKEKLPNSHHTENGKVKNKHHADNISKLLHRKDLSKERKNSSGSSSLSDSVHSKCKLLSLDSLDGNADEKVKADVTANAESHSKKLNQIRVNSCAESHSSKEDRDRERKNNDLSRSKKSERSGSQSNVSTSPVASSGPNATSSVGKKSKKSKKQRKSLSDSSSDSESESLDGSKKNHSIFDVVMDEPAYISMYDKVKARSTKNLQKQEEEKRQEKLKEKFSQLKQSRVKREEKKRSTSYEDDSDPDRSVSRKPTKIILDSSDEEHSSNDKVKLSVPSDSSDGERLTKTKMMSDFEEEAKKKLKKASHRLHSDKNKEKMKSNLTDTSEDDMKMKERKEKRRAFIKEAKLKALSGSDGSKTVPAKMYFNFSDEEIRGKSHRFTPEMKPKPKPKNNLREMIAKGELNKLDVKPFDHSNKNRLLSDVSEEEIVRPSKAAETKSVTISNCVDDSRVKLEKILSESSETESVGPAQFPKTNKKCNIYSDESDVEVNIKAEAKEDELFFNLAELHNSYPKLENSPPPLISPTVYDGDSELMKKKSHKKKQKRQKSIERSLERNKKHAKKERRKSVVSDLGDDDHKAKQKKKKKKNREKVKNVESLEEDIFGSMSDSSDKASNDPHKLSKLSVSDVYDADSDSSNRGACGSASATVSKVNNLEMAASSSVTKDKAGGFDDYLDHMKAKKKKRKKAKEEKTKHHPHHHHHHHNHRHHSKPEVKPLEVPEPPRDSSPPQPPSLSLSTWCAAAKSPPVCEPVPVSTALKSPAASPGEAVDIVTSSIVEKVHEEKNKVNGDNQKEQKVENEESVHQRAVQSISSDQTVQKRAVVNVTKPIPDTAVEPVPDAAAEKAKEDISQEETLFAVSNILLGESPTSYGFNDCYSVKPSSSPEEAKEEIVPLPRKNSQATAGSETKMQPETVLPTNDDSDCESVFTTPCGPSPVLDETINNADKSKYLSALDITITDFVAKEEDDLDESHHTTLSANESEASFVASKTPLEHSPTPATIENVDEGTTSLSGVSSERLTVETPSSPKVESSRPRTFPNNIAEKCEESPSESISSPRKVSSVNSAEPAREPSNKDVKCNGPSSLNMCEESAISVKDLTKDALSKPAENDPEEEVAAVPDKVEEITSKSEPPSDDTLPPVSLDRLDKLPDRRVEIEAALKQKLPIPAHQNTDMAEQLNLDLEHDSCEVNEANKENIGKSIKKDVHLVEMTDDTKLSTFLRNRERDVKDISRNVDDEIFRSSDFPRFNHKTSESNRNILEKVVQRIHESKRITQKSEDVPNVTEERAADKSVLPADEELTIADAATKVNDSSIIQNAVSYNCLVKLSNRERAKEVEPAAEMKKNETPMSGDFEFDDDTSQDVDDLKLDHAYNAKRNRRRRPTAGTGVVTRRGKNNVLPKETEAGVNFKAKKSSTDVYEFKEDSEDEVKRPRLILTIKNPVEPPPQPPVTNQLNETSVITECKPAPSQPILTNANAASPSKSLANTRKSRRLQEKDGNRSAVDDTIDEVVKTVQTPPRNTRRAAKAAAAAVLASVSDNGRKTSRPLKKQLPSGRTTETPVDSAATADYDEDESPPSPATFITPSPSVPTLSSPLSAKTEPTNLIDPVSGLLIPMKEAEEGQYVPVPSDLIQSQKLAEYPPEKKARLEGSAAVPCPIALVRSKREVAAPMPEAAKTSVIASVLQPVIKSTATTSCVSLPTQALPIKKKVLTPVLSPSVPAPSVPVERPAFDNGPISLIKTTTPSAQVSSTLKTLSARANAVTSPHLIGSHVPVPLASKLHPAKMVPSTRILTPITPKAHLLQAVGMENDAQSNDEVPYPSQRHSPLIHAAVASPPSTSPKISPQAIAATSARADHPVMNTAPLEPLKIDPASGYYYLPNTSPQPRASPQPRGAYNPQTMAPGLITHPTVQPAHYIPPQFVYQPYMQEPSITPYHHLPVPSSAGAAIMPDRGEVAEVHSSAAIAAEASPPPLELRKKTSPGAAQTNDATLITSPYVANNSRALYYGKPLLRMSHPSRIKVASSTTSPYSRKVDAIALYHPTRARLYETAAGACYPAHLDHEEDGEGVERLHAPRSYPDSNHPGARSEDRRPGELDYPARKAVPEPLHRDSSPGEMNSPPVGDSPPVEVSPPVVDSPPLEISPLVGDPPPQGNLDNDRLMKIYPIIWQGLLALKAAQSAFQMHVVSGNREVAYGALPKLQDGYQPLLRIAQRMRLEQAQLDGVNRKMKIQDEHCTIVGLPCGKDHDEVVQSVTNLKSKIIPYLESKKAAGIINTAAPGTQQAAFVVHVFPPCEYADNVLLNAAPDLYRTVQNLAYLVCIIVTV